ncbi:unnamed protein product [Ixodes pacificus]
MLKQKRNRIHRSSGSSARTRHSRRPLTGGVLCKQSGLSFSRRRPASRPWQFSLFRLFIVEQIRAR